MDHAPIIIDTHPLPEGVAGLTDGITIWLNPQLTTAGRRCTLAHELVHVERGLPAAGLEDREEVIVDRIASHRLTPTEQLIEALIWTHNTANRLTLADELDVDLSTLDTRLRTVTPSERDAINAALDALVEIP